MADINFLKGTAINTCSNGKSKNIKAVTNDMHINSIKIPEAVINNSQVSPELQLIFSFVYSYVHS